jgi:hypothetical protein
MLNFSLKEFLSEDEATMGRYKNMRERELKSKKVRDLWENGEEDAIAFHHALAPDAISSSAHSEQQGCKDEDAGSDDPL